MDGGQADCAGKLNKCADGILVRLYCCISISPKKKKVHTSLAQKLFSEKRRKEKGRGGKSKIRPLHGTAQHSTVQTADLAQSTHPNPPNLPRLQSSPGHLLHHTHQPNQPPSIQKKKNASATRARRHHHPQPHRSTNKTPPLRSRTYRHRSFRARMVRFTFAESEPGARSRCRDRPRRSEGRLCNYNNNNDDNNNDSNNDNNGV